MASVEKASSLRKQTSHAYRNRRKTITLLTNSEYGQANVFLAVVYELLLLQTYDITVASFAALKPRIEDINHLVPYNSLPARFHTITGPSSLEAVTSKNVLIGSDRPGVKGALNTYKVTLPSIAALWDEEEYMQGVESCLDILKSTSPDVIVIDPLLSQALDACKLLSRNCIVLTPNTVQEICRKQQPLSTQLFRWPATSSAFPYPIPKKLIPANVYLQFMLIWSTITSPTVKSLVRWRQSRGLTKLPPSFNIWNKDNQYLVVSVAETEYPCRIPSNVTTCGPILLPELPVLEQDPKLDAWLHSGPTMLISLGSHIRMDEEMVRQFSQALRIVLCQMPHLQVLWKLKTSGGVKVSTNLNSSRGENGAPSNCLADVEPWISSGQVKVLEWLSVDPLAILRNKNVVCSVHHGGSNSFHEALSAGVPQVILPCWFDTLDFANRVEWLGIGVFGSRKSAPGVEAQELSQALLKVLSNSIEATRMRDKAKELAAVSAIPGGRKRACQKIVEILGSTEKQTMGTSVEPILDQSLFV